MSERKIIDRKLYPHETYHFVRASQIGVSPKVLDYLVEEGFHKEAELETKKREPIYCWEYDDPSIWNSLCEGLKDAYDLSKVCNLISKTLGLRKWLSIQNDVCQAFMDGQFPVPICIGKQDKILFDRFEVDRFLENSENLKTLKTYVL